MKKMLKTTDFIGKEKDDKVFDLSEIPREFDVFYRSEQYFIKSIEEFDKLSESEKISIKNRYRFDPYRPGIYQSITGYGKMI